MDLSFLDEQFDGTVTPLLRTDVTDDAAWQRVVAAVTAETDFGDDLHEGDGGYVPNVEPVEAADLEGATAGSVAAAWDRHKHGYVLLADERSMREAAAGVDPTVVYVDLYATDEDEEEFGWVYGRSFRTLASVVASIEANLSEANMDFQEYADQADADGGVYRGFS